MSNLFWLTEVQMARLEPFFPKSHGKPRVDDRRVLSGIIFINRNGLRLCDAPKEYGPPKTLYSRGKRWSEKGAFARMMDGLAAEVAFPKTVMIDATYLKAHCTATSLRSKRGGRRPEGPFNRSNQGRHEHQFTCSHWRRWSPNPVLHDSRSGEWLHRSGSAAGKSTKGGVLAGRPRS
jgi:transposase